MAKKATTKASTADLLKRATSRPVRNVCWYDKVQDPDTRAFIDEIKSTRDGNGYVNLSEVSRILNDHFDVHIGQQRVASHVKGECTCARNGS